MEICEVDVQVCTRSVVGSSAICRLGSRVLRRICTFVSIASISILLDYCVRAGDVRKV